MLQNRIEYAREALGEFGQVVVFFPSNIEQVAAFEPSNVTVVCRVKPMFDLLTAAGYRCVVAVEGVFDTAFVCATRSKELNRNAVASAAAVVKSGHIILDGQKTDGIESLIKDVKKLGQTVDVYSKAHGKLAIMSASEQLTEFATPALRDIGDGFVTTAGVFSADGIDIASAMLAPHIQNLSGTVVDLGAGWGYLSRAVLQSTYVTTVHLVEADHAAVECARINVDDPRAVFEWADATTWRGISNADYVVMNPPFHTSRAADPGLGQAFIETASRILHPKGSLILVANRQLPYEDTLARHFSRVEQVELDKGFKILVARSIKKRAI